MTPLFWLGVAFIAGSVYGCLMTFWLTRRPKEVGRHAVERP